MKIIAIATASLLLMGAVSVSAVDGSVNISFRYSYKEFENAMRNAHNDISVCLDEFREAVKDHKDALRAEPINKETRDQLLLLVNALGDAAETLYDYAIAKKDTDFSKAEKYFQKAGNCYQELTYLYPKKIEFACRMTNSFCFSRISFIRGLAKELNEQEQVNSALLILAKLTTERQRFCSDYGEIKSLWEIMQKAVCDFEKSIEKRYADLIAKPPHEFVQLIVLINAGKSIALFSGLTSHKEYLKVMEDFVVSEVVGVVRKYRDSLLLAQHNIDQKQYTKAEAQLRELLSAVKSFPDYSSADQELFARMNKETDSFNLVSFSQDVNTRLVLARDNAKCLSLLESGRTAFKAKDWLTARDQFNEVATFSQDKKLLVDVSTIPDWLNRTNEEIRHVDEDKARELRHAEEKMARELLEQANKCVKSDKDHAIALLIKSAELGNTSSRAKLAHMYENPTDISIKGLYIGMKIDDAQSKLSALFKEKWIITAVEKQRDEGLHFAARKDRDFGPTVNVWADAKTRKVEQIRMDSGAVDLLFNVSDMDGKEFAQEVVSHYNIPEMKFEIIELNPGDRMAAELLFGANLVNRIGPTMQWQYKDPRGLVVAIEKDKTLVMKRIASAKDRKFD